MTTRTGLDIYQELGVRPVINARGNQTVLGGSSTSKEVLDAMAAANETYVEMEELLAKSGEVIARLLGTEAAYITSGCAAALALSTAACIAGKDPEKVGRIPDTSGMKNEVVFQQAQRYSYDRVYTIPGGRMVWAGDARSCTPEQLEAAFGPNTAALAYYLRPDWWGTAWGLPEWKRDIVQLKDAVAIAHRKGVPVVVDAAAQIYPLDYFRDVAQSADLVCFGAKYFGSPHSTGILTGKRELVEAAAAQGFIGFETAKGPSDWSNAGPAANEYRPFGRPFKVDRQEVVGVVVALKRWFSMNHEERLLGYEARLRTLENELTGIPGITILEEPAFLAPTTGLRVKLPPGKAGAVGRQLAEGDPSIWIRVEGDDVVANVHTLNEGEITILARRLREAISR